MIQKVLKKELQIRHEGNPLKMINQWHEENNYEISKKRKEIITGRNKRNKTNHLLKKLKIERSGSNLKIKVDSIEIF